MNAIDAVRNMPVRVGKSASVRNLALFPLSRAAPGPDYLTFAYAHACALVTVTEVSPGGRVSELLVSNQAELPVLVLEGEILLGLKQNRVLNTTVLVPAATEVRVPVSCVEMGRWQAVPRAAGGRSDVNLSPRVRGAKNESVLARMRRSGEFTSDQGVVWEAVGRALAAHEVAAPTSSFTEIAERRRGDVEAFVRGLEQQPGQCGVLAAIAGRPVCVDLFDRPETLAEVWEGLVASYVADALVDRSRPRTLGAVAAAAWLRGLIGGEASSHPGVGLGETVAVAGPRGIASALVVEGAVLHLAAFAAAGAIQRSRFAPPRERHA